jgi:hypothetical protein
MLHRFRSGRSVAKVLTGALVTLGALGALAVAASPAGAASAHHTTSASAATVVLNAARLGPDSGTSTFVAYTKEGFEGTAHTVTGCGGHNIPQPVNSYIFSYEGQHVFMYNCRGEACDVNHTLLGNASSKKPVGWQSLFVNC